MYVRILAVMLLSLTMVRYASADVKFVGLMSGAQVVPSPVATQAWGQFVAVHHFDTKSITVTVDFGGLSSGVTKAEIHCCGALTANSGVAIDLTGGLIPAGVTSGHFETDISLLAESTYDSAFFAASGGTGALAHDRLIGAWLTLANPNQPISYFQLFTSAHPTGELRGTIGEIPEPATCLTLVCGAMILCATRRRR